MAAGVRNCGSSVLDTDVTFVWASSSRLIDVRSRWSSAAGDADGPRRERNPSQAERRSPFEALAIFVLFVSNLVCYSCRVTNRDLGTDAL